MEKSDISLTEAVLLDQVQRGKRISDSAIALLRKKRLIEGRKPNIFIAKSLAQKQGKDRVFQTQGTGSKVVRKPVAECVERAWQIVKG